MAFYAQLNIINVGAKSHLSQIFLRERIPDLDIGFDPAYADAKGKARLLGDFNFFSSWMSQPKTQLETFKV